MKRTPIRLGLTSLVIGVVVACSGSDDDGGSPSTPVIEAGTDASTTPPIEAGPASGTLITAAKGGAIASADGVFTLTVPPGAIDADTTFSIRTLDPASVAPEVAATNPLGAIYDVQPSGLVFKVPATTTWKLPSLPAGVRDTNGNLHLVYAHSRSDDGSIEPHDETHTRIDGETLAVETKLAHLSQQWMTLQVHIRLRGGSEHHYEDRDGAFLEAKLGGGNHVVGETWASTRTAFDFFHEGLSPVSIFAFSKSPSIVQPILPPGDAWGAIDGKIRTATLFTEAGRHTFAPDPPHWKCIAAGETDIAVTTRIQFARVSGAYEKTIEGVATIEEHVTCELKDAGADADASAHGGADASADADADADAEAGSPACVLKGTASGPPEVNAPSPSTCCAGAQLFVASKNVGDESCAYFGDGIVAKMTENRLSTISLPPGTYTNVLLVAVGGTTTIPGTITITTGEHPFILDVTPKTATAGTEMTITGTGLAGLTSVTVAPDTVGQPSMGATLKTNTGTSATFDIPSGIQGTYRIEGFVPDCGFTASPMNITIGP